MSSTEPTDPSQGLPTGNLEAGVVNYKTRFILLDTNYTDPPSPDAYFASQNIPRNWGIQFDEQRIRIDEGSSDWGWTGVATILMDRGADSGTYGKELQCFPVKVPYISEPETEEFEEVDPPEITISDNEMTFKGYACKQAEWRNENEAWLVWFTTELSLPDDLPIPYRLEGIEGTIVSMREVPGPGALGVKEIELSDVIATVPVAEAFTLGKLYREFPDIAEARAANMTCLEDKLAAKPQADPAAYQGFWAMTGVDQNLRMQVAVEGDQVTMTQYPNDRDTPQVKKGTVRGDWIYLPQGKSYELYELRTELEVLLVHLTPPYTAWKRVDD